KGGKGGNLESLGNRGLSEDAAKRRKPAETRLMSRQDPIVHRGQIRRHEVLALRQACDLAGLDVNIEKTGAMLVLRHIPYPGIHLEERIEAPRFADPDGCTMESRTAGENVVSGAPGNQLQLGPGQQHVAV